MVDVRAIIHLGDNKALILFMKHERADRYLRFLVDGPYCQRFPSFAPSEGLLFSVNVPLDRNERAHSEVRTSRSCSNLAEPTIERARTQSPVPREPVEPPPPVKTGRKAQTQETRAKTSRYEEAINLLNSFEFLELVHVL